MRLSFAIFFVGACGAAIWAQASAPGGDADRRASTLPPPPDVVAGVEARLAGLRGLALTDVVLGEEATGGAWSFRARALDPRWPNDPALPVFGRVEPECAARRDRAECWRVTRLEIDGASSLPGSAR